MQIVMYIGETKETATALLGFCCANNYLGKYLYVLLASAQDQNNSIAGKYEIIPTRIDINCI
jgi:hypothetical protein